MDLDDDLDDACGLTFTQRDLDDDLDDACGLTFTQRDLEDVPALAVVVSQQVAELEAHVVQCGGRYARGLGRDQVSHLAL